MTVNVLDNEHSLCTKCALKATWLISRLSYKMEI